MKEKFVKYGQILGFPVECIADAMRGNEEDKEWLLEKLSVIKKREKLKNELLKEFEILKITEIEIQDPVNGERTFITSEMIYKWDIYYNSLRTWRDKTCRGKNYYLKMSHIENIICVMQNKKYPIGSVIFITPDYTYSNGGIVGVDYWGEERY